MRDRDKPADQPSAQPLSPAPVQPRDAATVVVLRDAAAGLDLGRAPEGRVPRVDGREATEGLWISPADAMQRWEDGSMQLAPATAKSIEMLLEYPSVDAALADAGRRPPPVSMPVVWNDKETGRAYISLPGDPRHPLPDVLGGRIRRFQLAEGRYSQVSAA